MSKTEDKHYISKDELWQEIESYYKLDEENRANGGDGVVMPDSLGNMILTLAKKIMSAQNFSGYPFKDQMEGDAYLRMVLILSKGKFNLWSQQKNYINNSIKFTGWAPTKKCEKIMEENPDYIIAPYSVEVDDDGNEIEGAYKLNQNVMVLKPMDDIYHEKDETMVKSFKKVGLEKGMFKKSTKSSSVTLSEPVMQPSYVKKGRKYEPIMVKNNAFGYLSLIARREAVTRIKKELKNYDAIHDYQEQEFLKFLSENPEMTPQRIDDDTYSIMDE